MTLNDLEGEVNALNQKIKSLEQLVEDLKKECSDLRSKNGELQGVVAERERRLRSMEIDFQKELSVVVIEADRRQRLVNDWKAKCLAKEDENYQLAKVN
jgi:predicted  nucleic acid-binding Zn-ribbon protein